MKNGELRKPMRRFVGGVILAFLKAYLHDDNEDLLAIRDRHVSLPVEIPFMRISWKDESEE